MREVLRPTPVKDDLTVIREAAIHFLKQPVKRTRENVERYGWGDGLKYSSALLIPPPALGVFIYAGLEQNLVGAGTVGTLMWLMESVILNMDPSLKSIEQRLEIDLKEESQHFMVWPNGLGIEWNMSEAEQIVCNTGPKSAESDPTTLRVDLLTGPERPAYRKPTLVEVARFVRVADYVDPKSPHTERLKEIAYARLLREETNVGALRKMVYR